MSTLTVAIREDQTAFRPGEEIAGALYWKLDQPPERLELRLFWYTRGKGSEDAAIVETSVLGQPLQEEARAFRFQLPDSPYSFSGRLISLIWALELVAKPSDEVARLEFVLGPEAKEVVLGSVPQDRQGKSGFFRRTK